MTSVVVVKNRGEWEPIHPGSIDSGSARRLWAEMCATLPNRDFEVWSTDKWDRYDDAIRAEMVERGEL